MRTAVLALLSLAACPSPEPEGPVPVDLPPPDLAEPEIGWREAGAPPISAPVMTCPSGWRAVISDAGAQTCDPWPAEGREVCAVLGDAHLPGTAGCAPVGAACGQGWFAVDLPESGVWYVRPGAEGDGSRDAPFSTVSEAVQAAGAGDAIALSRGTHVGGVVVDSDVAFVGACAAETVWTDPSCDPDSAVLTVAGGRVSVSDLSIADATCAGVALEGGELELAGVAVVRNTRAGVWVSGGALNAEGVVLEDNVADPATGLYGQGLSLTGGTAVITGGEVVGNRRRGVLAFDDAEALSLIDVVVADNRADPSGRGGDGVAVFADAAVGIERVAVEDNQGGIVLLGAGAATLADVVVRGVLSNPAGEFGRGMEIDDGFTLDARRVWVSGANETGITFIDAGPATLTDVVIEKVRPAPAWPGTARAIGVIGVQGVRIERAVLSDTDGDVVGIAQGSSVELVDTVARAGRVADGYGCSVLVIEASHVAMDRVHLADSERCGAHLQDRSTASAVDVLVTGNAPNGFDTDVTGYGWFTVAGSTTEASRVVFRDIQGSAIGVVEGGVARFEDVVVDGVAVAPLSHSGEGAQVWHDAQLTLVRAWIGDVGWGGVRSHDTAVVHLEDVVVDGVGPAGDGTGGEGIIAMDDSRIDGAGVIVRSSRQAAIRTTDHGVIELSEVYAAGTSPMACVDTTCPEHTAALGVHAGGDRVALTDFVLIDNGTAGAVAAGGELVLTDGWIADSPVGLFGNAVLQGVEFQGVAEDQATGEPPPVD